MNVVIISAEMAPLAVDGTGIIANEIAQTGYYLAENGASVLQFLPRYSWISKKDDINRIYRRIRLRMGQGNKEFNIYQHEPLESGVRPYLIGKDLYFKRDTCYGDSTGTYPDHFERFEYFSMAFLEALKVIDFKPDIILCMGSPLAIATPLIKSAHSQVNFYDNASVFYIDFTNGPPNTCDIKTFQSLNVSEFLDSNYQPGDTVNFSEMGIANADKSYIVDTNSGGTLNKAAILADIKATIETRQVQFA